MRAGFFHLAILGLLAMPTLALASNTFTTGSFTLHQGASYSFGALALKMQTDGNAVIYNGTQVLWSTGTAGQNCSAGNCLIAFQGDGNLVVYNGSTALWASYTSGSQGALLQFSTSAPYISIASAKGSNKWASSSVFPAGQFSLVQNDTFSFGTYVATMQSNGNFVISKNGVSQWATGSTSSCSGGCVASFQSDGNFVLYNGSTAFWSSQTAGNPAATLAFSVQGSLMQMFSSQGSNLWSTNASFLPGQFVLNQNDYYVNHNGYKVTMQSDGNFVTYNGATVLFQTGSHASCGSNTCHAVYQSDGNFVIYNGSTAIWSSSTSTQNAGFLSFQFPYIQIDQIVGSSCRIVYPQAFACAAGYQTPLSFSNVAIPASGQALATVTFASAGVGSNYFGGLSIGASVSNAGLTASYGNGAALFMGSGSAYAMGVAPSVNGASTPDITQYQTIPGTSAYPVPDVTNDVPGSWKSVQDAITLSYPGLYNALLGIFGMGNNNNSGNPNWKKSTPPVNNGS
jgi:hypothetical protein